MKFYRVFNNSIYYRLKLIDNTHRVVYSAIEKITRNTSLFRAYPIPVKRGELLTVELSDEKDTAAEVHWVDVLGRIVQGKKNVIIQNNTFTLSTQSLWSGVYQLMIRTKNKYQYFNVLVIE